MATVVTAEPSVLGKLATSATIHVLVAIGCTLLCSKEELLTFLTLSDIISGLGSSSSANGATGIVSNLSGRS